MCKVLHHCVISLGPHPGADITKNLDKTDQRYQAVLPRQPLPNKLYWMLELILNTIIVTLYCQYS